MGSMGCGRGVGRSESLKVVKLEDGVEVDGVGWLGKLVGMKRIFLLGIFGVGCLGAEVVERDVVYESGGVEFEGFHVYDDEVEGKRPGVLIVHQWTGLTENEKMRARMMAELGYNVFAVDVYGKGVRPKPPEAGDVAGIFKKDRALFRERMVAGLEVLKSDERTEGSRLAAVGYCFGGMGVLELARGGVDLKGVVSFHGSLGAAEGMGAEKGKVKAKVLCLHGAVDPFVPREELEGFEKEMEEASVDWQLVSFGGAVHAFTQKSAGDDVTKGAAYNAKADARSWEYLEEFLEEIFGED